MIMPVLVGSVKMSDRIIRRNDGTLRRDFEMNKKNARNGYYGGKRKVKSSALMTDVKDTETVKQERSVLWKLKSTERYETTQSQCSFLSLRQFIFLFVLA